MDSRRGVCFGLDLIVAVVFAAAVFAIRISASARRRNKASVVNVEVIATAERFSESGIANLKRNAEIETTDFERVERAVAASTKKI